MTGRNARAALFPDLSVSYKEKDWLDILAADGTSAVGSNGLKDPNQSGGRKSLSVYI